MTAPQIVIDTNVWVAAFRARSGASWKLTRLLGTDSFDAHISVPLALEHEKVFREQREEMGLTESTCERLLNVICRLSTRREIYYLWRTHVSDPDDAHVMELAVAASADVIVTYNKRDFTDAHSFGIDLMTSPEFLRYIGQL